jgi:hypothetical protein
VVLTSLLLAALPIYLHLPLSLLPAAQKDPDESLLLGQTEAYVEYDRTGRVIKGQEVKKRSRCVVMRDQMLWYVCTC